MGRLVRGNLPPRIAVAPPGPKSRELSRRLAAFEAPGINTLGPGDAPAVVWEEALGANVAGAAPADAGRILADRITWFMARLGVPNGLKAVGYTSADIPSLVEGTLPQHRVTKLSPRPAGPDELAALFEDAMVAW